MQENLAPAQESPREVINGCASLLNVAKKLSIPFLIAEQDRSKFGPTMIDLRNVLGDDGAYFEKDTLSCYKNDNIRRAIEKSGKKQLIIAGLERIFVCSRRRLILPRPDIMSLWLLTAVHRATACKALWAFSVCCATVWTW